jgi:hypothetical protein
VGLRIERAQVAPLALFQAFEDYAAQKNIEAHGNKKSDQVPEGFVIVRQANE